jgi:LmbE family N-acetylglucosaminyl deacetylase
VLVVGRSPLHTSVSRILCLGAHCDDIELGCGASVRKLVEANPNVEIDWVVLSSTPRRAIEAREGAERFLRTAKRTRVVVEQFRERYFNFLPELKEYFDRLATSVRPDLIFTHHEGDLHQDHRTVAELTRTAFRDQLILEYEVPKYDGDLRSPNVFVELDLPASNEKVRAILESFPSQADKHWFSEETMMAVLRLRGIESKAPGGYAEGFHVRKLVLV